jgi:hypothetical protein
MDLLARKRTTSFFRRNDVNAGAVGAAVSKAKSKHGEQGIGNEISFEGSYHWGA